MIKKQENIGPKKMLLRKSLREIRLNISAERKKEAAKNCFKHLHEKLEKYKMILSFSSLNEEIDINELNQQLIAEKRLLLPRVRNQKIEAFYVENVNQLKQSKWGILEPDDSSKKCENSEIDCVLVPGLGFDTQNQRIGFGGGYYDAFLCNLNKETMKIGIGFKEQDVDSIPIEEHDQKLDSVLLF